MRGGRWCLGEEIGDGWGVFGQLKTGAKGVGFLGRKHDKREEMKGLMEGVLGALRWCVVAVVCGVGGCCEGERGGARWFGNEG